MYLVESGSPDGQAVKNLPAMQEMQETWVWSLSQEDLLEEDMPIHSSTLLFVFFSFLNFIILVLSCFVFSFLKQIYLFLIEE